MRPRPPLALVQGGRDTPAAWTVRIGPNGNTRSRVPTGGTVVCSGWQETLAGPPLYDTSNRTCVLRVQRRPGTRVARAVNVRQAVALLSASHSDPPEQGEPSASLRAALDAAEEIVDRSGAPLVASQLARIVERQGLGAEEAAAFRVHARSEGLFVDELADEADADPVALVTAVGTSALAADYASLTPFWRAARRYPLLDAGQERTLAMRIAQGIRAEQLLGTDDEFPLATRAELGAQVMEGHQAKDAFICCNLRLVATMVRPFHSQGLELPDLLQEGILGLIRAVEKFDHTMGYKFSTYATWWIRQAAQRAVADKGRTIRIPVHVHELLGKIIATERRLCWELEREPTIHDVATRLNIDPGHAAFVKQASAGIGSLDASVRADGSEDSSLIDFIAGVEPSVEQQVLDHARTEYLGRALAALSTRDADVLRKRHGLAGAKPWTLDEVGRAHHVTRERVRQWENTALKQLRNFVERSMLLDEPLAQPDEPSSEDAKEPPAVPLAFAAVTGDQSMTRAAIDGELLRRMRCLTPEEHSVMVRRFGVAQGSMSEQAVAVDLGRDKSWVLDRQESAVRKLRVSDAER